MLSRAAFATLVVTGVASIAFACPCACALAQPGDSHAAETPLAVLRRVLTSEERVRFAARQTVILSDRGRADATVTDEVNFGFARGRVTWLLPENNRGRVSVRDGRRRWAIEPSSRTVVESEVVHRPITAARAETIARQVARSYVLAIAKEPSSVAGRPALILTLAPRRPDRQRRMWWVDRQTGLVLKREVYSPGGGLEQSTSYSNLRMNIPVDVTLLKPAVPRGYRVVRRPADNVVTRIESARRLIPAFGDIPASLGAGFEFESARLVDADGARSLQLQYSDGLAGLSLFKIPARTRLPQSAGRTRTVAVGSASGTIMESVAPYRVLTWEIAGATFNLVSDVSEGTMIAIARSVHF
jgi:negative regulator of sigma E activity